MHREIFLKSWASLDWTDTNCLLRKNVHSEDILDSILDGDGGRESAKWRGDLGLKFLLTTVRRKSRPPCWLSRSCWTMYFLGNRIQLSLLCTYRWFLRFGQKKSQRHVAHHFEALNLSFQMVYSCKSGDMRFLRKLGFCVSLVTQKFNIFY